MSTATPADEQMLLEVARLVWQHSNALARMTPEQRKLYGDPLAPDSHLVLAARAACEMRQVGPLPSIGASPRWKVLLHEHRMGYVSDEQLALQVDAYVASGRL
jgi:hypothetical protein